MGLPLGASKRGNTKDLRELMRLTHSLCNYTRSLCAAAVCEYVYRELGGNVIESSIHCRFKVEQYRAGESQSEPPMII